MIYKTDYIIATITNITVTISSTLLHELPVTSGSSIALLIRYCLHPQQPYSLLLA
jgi:hypothetical protein